MTHKQKVEQLFGELGVAYSERKAGQMAYASESGVASAAAWESSIDLSEGLGLPALVASFYFDADEKFLGHRVWKKE